MSPGDQLIQVLIDSIGVFIEAIITSIIEFIFVPFIQAIFGG